MKVKAAAYVAADRTAADPSSAAFVVAVAADIASASAAVVVAVDVCT